MVKPQLRFVKIEREFSRYFLERIKSLLYSILSTQMIQQNIRSLSFIYFQDSKRKEDRPGKLPLGKVIFFKFQVY